MTIAALRALLVDCLRLWDVQAQVTPVADGVAVATAEGVFTVTQADPGLRPVRWFLQTPERSAAGRPARAIPSIVALLSALRNPLGAGVGDRARIGT